MKAQSSLEALVAFAALLSALALLISQAQSSAAASAGIADASGERIRLSYAALSLDTAGSTLHAVQIAKPEGIIAGGWALRGTRSGALPEPMFHEVSAQGDMYVVGTESEKA